MLYFYHRRRWVSDREDDIDFAPNSEFPPHFQFWRYPNEEYFEISPEDHPNTLRINPSKINLTALNGNYAGPGGQAFVGRKQQDTLFTYSVDLDFAPEEEEEEAGITAFLTQNHHLDLGVVYLPSGSETASFPGPRGADESAAEEGDLVPHLRFRAMSYLPVPDTLVVPLPGAWVGETLRLEISAKNNTHYSFSAGPASARSQVQTIIDVSNEHLSWGFNGEFPKFPPPWTLFRSPSSVVSNWQCLILVDLGAILGIYATSNGGNGSTPAYFSKWKYTPQEQFRD